MDVFDRMDRYFRNRMNEFFGPSFADDLTLSDRPLQRITSSSNPSDALTTTNQPVSNLSSRWPLYRRLGSSGLPTVHVNVTEDEKSYFVSAELPGIPKESVKVFTEGNTLFIQGEKKSETSRDTDQVHLYERSFGTFSRTLVLPDNCNLETPTAAFENGVLNLTFPKKESSNRKTITF